MLRLVSDENFRRSINRALLRERRDLDLVTVVGEGLSAIVDRDLLAWAAAEDRIVLTHDRKIAEFVYERVDAGDAMPGVIIVRLGISPRRAAEEILTVLLCSDPEELRAKITYVPL